ncbi:MAG: FAD-dependent oxidoreductase, partial [Solirubrobacteraceae bacterium]
MRRKVLIAGGGVGGLEAALALRALAGERLDIELLAPERHFTYRPLAVAEPFGRAATIKVEVARIAAERGFGVTRDVLDAVLTDERAVVTQDGCHLAYDDLVLALGARPRVAVPGALTFRGPQDVWRMTQALHAVETDRHRLRVAFLAPRGTTWTLPLYELALLTEAWASARKLAIDISIITPEPFALAAFGPDASADVQRLLDERRIAIRTNCIPDASGDGVVRSVLGERVPADVAVALPMLVGPNVRGAPSDALGFTPVDDLCRVEGLDRVYAIGDMAAREIKQGGLAAQQADVAAAAIAAAAGAPV